LPKLFCMVSPKTFLLMYFASIDVMIAVLLRNYRCGMCSWEMPFNSWIDRKNLKSEFLKVAAIARLIVGCVSRDGKTSA
jgi:hypothetical protein